MSYSVFNKNDFDATKEPMFLGETVNVARYDKQRYPVFEKLTEKQLSFFWRPEEIDVSKDRIDFGNLSEHEQHIFLSNLKYQTLLDSIQGRSPNVVLLPLVSVPELETWIETWAAFETIHSRSYTHIIRNIINDPSLVFDDIVANEEILKRAEDIAHYYDDLYKATITREVLGEASGISIRDLKKKLYLCMVAVNVLEGIRFYVSFACSFAFAERKLMEGNAKIIKMIARDEALHLTSTQHMINIMANGREDNEMAEVAQECMAEAIDIFKRAAEQEKAWADYLFKDGSMIGLNKAMLCEYVEYITNERATAIGMSPIFPQAKGNPFPWIMNWLASDNVQVAPQETEITSYLVGQIDSNLGNDAFDDFVL